MAKLKIDQVVANIHKARNRKSEKKVVEKAAKKVVEKAAKKAVEKTEVKVQE